MFKLKLLEINLITNFKKSKITIQDIECLTYFQLIDMIKNKVLTELNDFKIENLYFRNNISVSESLINQHISNNSLQIFYKSIVSPKCAKEYCRLDGLIFFFHTNEDNHKFNPHIHVLYNEEEISIYLKDFDIIGSFKNKKKQKIALQYVMNNSKLMLEEWNKLI